MTTTQKPDALRLADKYEVHGFLSDQRYAKDYWCSQAAAELRRQHARIAELEAQLAAIGAGGVEPLRKRAAASQAVQAAVPQTDWESAAEKIAIEVADNCGTVPNLTHPHIYLGLKKLFATAHPAEGVPAQTETLLAELAEETEAAENWRRLSLQFDHHRLQALGHLKAILHPDSSVDEYKTAELFLKAPPLDGESVLAQRIAELSATTQAQADAQDTDRWMGIGKAIERACADLPEETEIIVSLEKDAGTVTLIDQDGNEHENFSTDYGFAGVLNEAIDTAIAAQAKN